MFFHFFAFYLTFLFCTPICIEFANNLFFLLQFERQKKLEREHKKKQEAQTLEETKEQIVQLEQKLSNHKQEKHKLFQTLKKVLYEDETRRNRSEAPHPNLYLQPNVRNAPSMLRMGHTTQLLIQQAKL